MARSRLLLLPALAAGLVAASPAARAAEPEPSFEAVLSDPDNPDLNYRYARARAARGDFHAALPALERALLADPDHHPARFLYALSLYRVGNWTDAERELGVLARLPVPESVRADVSGLRREIGRRRSRTRLEATAGFDFDFDTNRNASPASRQVLVEDRPIDLRPDSGGQEDSSVVGLLQLRGRRDLGRQAGHEAFVSAGYYRSESSAFQSIDLQSFSGQAGLALKTPWAEITPSGSFDHLRLSEETFLRSSGGGLRADRPMGSRASIYMEGRAAYQRYSPTSDLASAAERSGRQLDGGAGGWLQLGRGWRLGAGWAYGRKDAARLYNAYGRHTAYLSPAWTSASGAFAQLSLSAAFDRYREPDPLVSRLRREDDILRARFTVGFPLSCLGRLADGFLLAQSMEINRSESNLPNYTFGNSRYSAMLVYNHQWAF